MVRQFKRDFKHLTVNFCTCGDNDECGEKFCQWTLLVWCNSVAALVDQADDPKDGNANIVSSRCHVPKDQIRELSYFFVNGTKLLFYKKKNYFVFAAKKYLFLCFR